MTLKQHYRRARITEEIARIRILQIVARLGIYCVQYYNILPMKSEQTASTTEQSRNARDEEARTSSLKHPYDLAAVSLSHQEL